MEAVRQVVDSSLLNGVISLPRNFQNRKVELFVFLNEEKASLPKLAKNDIETMLKGSVAESLIGVIPQSAKTLDEHKAERLSKYERTD